MSVTHVSLDAAVRAALAAQFLVREQGWWWISAESVAFSPLSRAVPEGEAAGGATLWTLHSRRADGSVQAQA